MGRAKLEGPAKLWWKLNCENRGILEYNQVWEDLKERLRERYLPLNYSIVKMNEFLSCTRKGMTIEKYHEELSSFLDMLPSCLKNKSLVDLS